jgi:hypothetical protein
MWFFYVFFVLFVAIRKRGETSALREMAGVRVGASRL